MAQIITCQDLSDITQLSINQGSVNLDGELTIPRNASLTIIGDRVFRDTKLRGKLVIPENITRLGEYSSGGDICRAYLMENCTCMIN